MAKKNAWSSVKFGTYTVKYSKSNKTWQVWRNGHIVIDYHIKKTAMNYAKRKHLLND